MSIFIKRNQIILLNFVFIALYIYGLYDNYKQHGSISYVYSTDEGNNTRPVSIIINGIFILCLCSILSQLLDNSIKFRNPNRFYFIKKVLKITNSVYGFLCFIIGTIFIKGLVENIAHQYVYETYNFLFLVLAIVFFYLSYLIFKQLFFNRKKKLISNQILDEEIE
jgi:predicted Na+-dependent transporter